MAQRNTPSGSSRQGRGRPAPVAKPFPWGFALGSGALALLLVGILVFAVANKGAGYTDPAKIAGLVVAPAADQEMRTHVPGAVNYPRSPPDTGNHNAAWENCAVYTQQIPNEHAVHSLEHGAVWITYRPDLPADQVKRLADLARAQTYLLMSPYPGQASPVVLSAWGRQLAVDTASDKRVQQFITAFRDGPQTPEKGAACTGGVSITGTTPLGPPATAQPSPARS